MNSNESSKYFGEEKINKLMLKFSIPCIMSLLVSSLYNIVDQIFIGNSELSALGNAATGVVFPVFIIAQAFAWCFGDGCAAFLRGEMYRRREGFYRNQIGVCRREPWGIDGKGFQPYL